MRALYRLPAAMTSPSEVSMRFAAGAPHSLSVRGQELDAGFGAASDEAGVAAACSFFAAGAAFHFRFGVGVSDIHG